MTNEAVEAIDQVDLVDVADDHLRSAATMLVEHFPRGIAHRKVLLADLEVENRGISLAASTVDDDRVISAAGDVGGLGQAALVLATTSRL